MSQAISQELLDFSSKTTGLLDDFHIKANHYALQTQVSLSYNCNIQSNTLFGKSGYKNDSETTLYRTNSTTIKNTNSRYLNTVSNPYISNKKGLINDANVISSDKYQIKF